MINVLCVRYSSVCLLICIEVCGLVYKVFIYQEGSCWLSERKLLGVSHIVNLNVICPLCDLRATKNKKSKKCYSIP